MSSSPAATVESCHKSNETIDLLEKSFLFVRKSDIIMRINANVGDLDGNQSGI